VVAALGRAALVPTAAASAASAPIGYMSAPRGSATVTFVEFTVSGPRLVGAVTTDTVTNTNPNAYLASNTARFTGTDSGGHLTVYFGGYGSVPEFGSVNGGSLSLQVPQTNGTIATVSFARTSVATYNQYISRWQTVINNANSAARAAAAKAAAAAGHQQQLLNRLNQTINTVDSDLSAIQSPGTLGNDEGVLGNDVGVVSNDLGVVGNDNNVFRNDIDSGSNPCGDIMSAFGDARTAYTDGQTVVSDAKSDVGSDLRDEQQTMAAAPSDWAEYWQAQHALPRYRPTSPIPSLKVALADGKGVINGAVSQVNSYINQANGYVARAYLIVNAANKANRCRAAHSAPIIGRVTAGSLTS
jgi:hypothetical protein